MKLHVKLSASVGAACRVVAATVWPDYASDYFEYLDNFNVNDNKEAWLKYSVAVFDFEFVRNVKRRNRTKDIRGFSLKEIGFVYRWRRRLYENLFDCKFLKRLVS